MQKIVFILILLISSITAKTAPADYQIFDNYHLSPEANSVRCFIQDEQGVMWMGTDKGLCSFDGYTTYPHYVIGERSNSIVNCAILIKDSKLLLGTEFGVLLYNIKTDRYEPILSDFNHDIRSLLKVGNEIWIGCFDGLFIYNVENEEINELFVDPKKETKHRLVYTMLEDDGYIYLGSNRRFGRFSIHNKKFEVLDTSKTGGNVLVNSLFKDDKQGCIWIGQGGGLLKYDIDSGDIKYVGQFNVVKSMLLDSENNLVMGTDNGLCILKKSSSRYIVHDSRDSKSLGNNVVWCVFKDASENIWLGTDNGISLLPKYRRFNYIPIYNITKTGEGNQFYSIYHDSYNNYWLGGTNGLIMSQSIINDNSDIRWYKMGGSQFYISHNHIRDIFEDKERNLWVATDFGLNKYNRPLQKFTRFTIYSPDKTQNAIWAYDILEDNINRLWVASHNGGIFVIDKNKLTLDNSTPIADHQYSIDNGLSGNNVDFIFLDKNENLWALIHNISVDVINSVTGEISTFPIKKYTGGMVPNYLMGDTEGNIWTGYPNGVARIDPVTKDVTTIALKGTNNIEVLEMIELEKSIWVSTTDGIWVIDKKELTIHHLNQLNQVFTSMYYDAPRKQVILGGIDFIAISETETTSFLQSETIIIGAIYVNNQMYTNDENSSSIRYTDQIKLAHNQNNIEIEFSDLTYTEENKERFIYKINDDENWTRLPSGENKIFLNKLNPGTYNLNIGKLEEIGKSGKSIKNFSITITPPWYASIIARISYLLLLLALVWWIYFFITSRKKMRYDQMEKEETLKQSRLKISFFSDVAHEFKTPLSLIIAPLSGLIRGTKDDKDRSALQMIHQNAMKLNSLIHQAIDYYRDDSKVNIGLILSKIELIAFARSIFLSYKEGMKDKNIEFIFNSEILHLYLNIDTVKIESVINNLLSNACKFTHSGDSIIFSIKYQPVEGIVEMKVADTGTGIPQQDLPYIFQRFFQSSANSNEHEGTGIGLFLVKNYVDLHGGEVKAFSKTDEGTTISVCLPVLNPELEQKEITNRSEEKKTGKQLIVIVEDNIAIAEFVYNTFIDEYRCMVAHNGKTGLKLCTELKPDLIIADVMMPVMDGMEMANRLKNNILTATIPLVLLTAKDDKETELQSIKLNIEAFIAKPFDSSILYSRVKQILENRKLLEKKARIEQLSTPKIEKTDSQDEKFLAKITKIIEDKIDDPELNVNMLCALANISSKQLYRKIKQLTGLTTVDYIKSIRMKKAAMYLSRKNFTIAEVMYMVGFSNHSYFAKCFQAKFGITPRQFTEKNSSSASKED